MTPVKEVLFGIKTNHPTRKVIEKVLYNRDGRPVTDVKDRDHDADFVDMKATYSMKQAKAWMKTAHIAMCDADGKFYPVNDENVLDEQYALIANDEALTIEEDANFGIHKPEYYVVDPITGGETVESDVLGKKLGEIQSDIEFENGVVRGTLYKVTNFTGFNSADVKEQNGYYLVFYIKKADMEAEPVAAYTDIKFLVAGGSGNEVEPDEGMNIIYLGATEDEVRGKKLAIKAHATVDNEVLGTYEADTFTVFDLDLILEDRKPSVIGHKTQLYINNEKEIVDPVELGKIEDHRIEPMAPVATTPDEDSDEGEEEIPPVEDTEDEAADGDAEEASSVTE